MNALRTFISIITYGFDVVINVYVITFILLSVSAHSVSLVSVSIVFFSVLVFHSVNSLLQTYLGYAPKCLMCVKGCKLIRRVLFIVILLSWIVPSYLVLAFCGDDITFLRMSTGFTMKQFVYFFSLPGYLAKTVMFYITRSEVVVDVGAILLGLEILMYGVIRTAQDSQRRITTCVSSEQQ